MIYFNFNAHSFLKQSAFSAPGGVSIRLLALLLFVTVLVPLKGLAQVSFTGTYVQDFNSMGTGSTIPPGWTHIGKLGGSASSWSTSIPASGNPSAASSGTVNNSLIVATNTFSGTSNTRAFNYSDGNTTNRALGTSPTSDAGNILQLSLTNSTGSPLSSLQLSYNIRRFANAASPESLPGYRLFVSVNGGTIWTNVAALNPTISTLPNTVGTSNFSLALTLPAPVLAAGQLRLRWVDDNSASSAVDQRIGLDDVSITLSAPAACGSPAFQFAGGLTASSALLSWQAVPGAQSYNLRWKATSAASFTNVNGLTTNNYSLTGLQANTSYEFQVQAVCASGSGSFSASTTFITAASNPACTAATNLNAINITSTSALLTWTAGIDVNYFTVFWKPVNATNFNIQGNLQFTTWQLTGLTPATDYVFQIQAICGGVDEEPAILADLSPPSFFTTAGGQRTGNTLHEAPSFTVWPNPTAGGQLNVRMDRLNPELATATVDLIDPFGKRVDTYTLPVSNGVLNTTMNLPAELVGGLYVLRVNAGTEQFSQRLVVR